MSAIQERKHKSTELRAIQPVELHRRIEAGFVPAMIDEAIKTSGVSKQVVFATLGSRSTIERRMKSKQRLSVEESDRLARFLDVFELARDVFGDKDKARHWLLRDSAHLAGEGAPIDLLTTSQGTDIVRERLEQIRHGIFA